MINWKTKPYNVVCKDATVVDLSNTAKKDPVRHFWLKFKKRHRNYL